MTDSVNALTPLPGLSPAAATPRPAVPTAGRRDAPGAGNPAPAAPGSGNAADLQAHIAEIEQYLRLSQSNLQFSVDRDLGRVVISIVDADTGEILRQIPSEEVLQIARRLRQAGNGLVDQSA